MDVTALSDEEDDFGFHLVDKEALISEYENEQEKRFTFYLKSIPLEIRQKLNETWPSVDNHTLLTYPMEFAIKEMSRESSFKSKAYTIGIIRPFLWLVSMHPMSRYCIAKTMNIKLEKYDLFGDSHFESWQIIAGHHKKSLQALVGKRESEAGNWFGLLYHVMKCAMGNSSRISEDTKIVIKESKPLKVDGLSRCYCRGEPSTLRIEEAYLNGLYEVMESIRKEHHQDNIPEEWLYTIKLADSEIVTPLVDKLQEYGNFKNIKLASMLAATALRSRAFHMNHNLQGWAERKSSIETLKKMIKVTLPATMITLNLSLVATSVMTLSPLILIPSITLSLNVSRLLIVTDEPLLVFLPISAILSQREVLSYHELSIEKFYPILPKNKGAQ